VAEANFARSDTLAKLAQSRAEIRRVLDPPVHPDAAAGEQGGRDGMFPRSRTMRMLLSVRGVGTVGALAGGLLLARPALALKLLRMIPAGAVGRMLLVKALAALKDKRG
jgi:hypothetical protein